MHRTWDTWSPVILLVGVAGALLAGLCSRPWWNNRSANVARGGYRGRPWSEHSR
ncbi:hypothetical protein R8Z50_00345 [Longispora sp. K20-0274]|uniref:hypothetical protein n=1 Tax=Longispora sp. K20-0274 TaxID=3088255 RepID=UPI00399BC02C